MNIAVLAKVAPDTTAQIKAKPDGSGIDKAGIKWSISAYDEFAIEESIALKEKKKAEKVFILTAGDDEAVAALRAGGLARGGDEIHQVSDPAVLASDSLGVARTLAALVKAAADVQLVFTGKQAIDDDNVQVPAMVAELLGWPHVSFVSAFELDGTTFKATRNVGGGMQEVVQGSLPVVITADKGLNTPRYPKLPDIMKAKTKPVVVKKPGDLGLSAADIAPAVIVSNYAPPAARAKGKQIAGDAAAQVKELVRLLREEAKVL